MLEVQKAVAENTNKVKVEETPRPIKLNRAQLRKAVGELKNKQNGHPPKANLNKKKRKANSNKRKVQKASRKTNY